MVDITNVDDWGSSVVALGVTNSVVTRATQGNPTQALPLASVTKLITAFTCWVAVEEGTVSLDTPAGPPGATIAHLLAHASGLGPDGPDVLAAPGERRIYSNYGFELAASAVAAAAEMEFWDYATAAVVEPLAMTNTTLMGSPAHGASSCVEDLLRLGRELLAPTLIDPSTLATATSIAWPELNGVLPGYGTQRPNPWGLGVEIRGEKAPHWTAANHSPSTFGHFGRAGTLLWVDPEVQLAGAIVTNRDFGKWAVSRWPIANAALRSLGMAQSS